MSFFDRLFGRGKRAQPVATIEAPAPVVAAATPAKSPSKAPVAATTATASSTPAPKAAPKPAVTVQSSGKAPPGPLKLSVGDFVSHYRERFIVAGVRMLDGDGAKTCHYCLHDANGTRAVLVAEDRPDPALSMQHHVNTDARWDADVVSDVPDGPFRLKKSGETKVRSWDDAGVAGSARSVKFRTFEDAGGDSVLVMEDYDGRRECRVGTQVFEAELEFERATTGRKGGIHTVALGGASAFEDTIDDDICKGSPRAAARVLEFNVGSSKASRKGMDDEQDPGTYVDEWSDAQDVAPAAAPVRSRATVTKDASEDLSDEWNNATNFVRENGDAGRTPEA